MLKIELEKELELFTSSHRHLESEFTEVINFF